MYNQTGGLRVASIGHASESRELLDGWDLDEQGVSCDRWIVRGTFAGINLTNTVRRCQQLLNPGCRIVGRDVPIRVHQ